MQQEFYTSCLKINGIPLLPPLMTDTIKEEMRCYRSLAAKVEENLRNRQLVKRTIQDKGVQADIIEPIDKLKSIRYSSDSDVSSHGITSDTNTSDTHSKTTIVEPVSEVAREIKDNHDIQSSISDIQHSQFQVCLTEDIINDSKPVMIMADQNECITMTEATTLNEDVTLSESWKPEIPRTLDIVPITLSNDEEDVPSTEASKETENPPKLSRQGSYVLDTPSPMLLAHIHTELTHENYVPTPTTNTSQRKQWNIAQPKVEWENKQLMNIEVSSKSDDTARSKPTFQHGESNDTTEPHQVDISADRTEAVIVEEDASRLNVTPTKHNRKFSTIVDLGHLKKTSSLEISEKSNDASLLNLSSRESTGESTNSPKIQLSRTDEMRRKMESIQAHPIIKMKSSLTPDKLLTVYKEIEELHKKQMMELIYRQRKEQSLLQAEFQKQQLLLLAEMRKCAFGTPRSDAKAKSASGEARQESNAKQKSPGNVRAEAQCNIKLPLANRVIVCPLDYLPMKNLYLLKHHKSVAADNSPRTLDFDFARKVSLCDTTYNNNNNNNINNNDDNSNYESRDFIVYKNSTVSRQLFPLDSNTTHVPVLDTSVYHEKHIRAVNTINAYTRGYLVRRLMRTERVVTLKKVYKEALQCMLKLHVDAPLNSAEVDFLHRLQLQCDAASMNIVELFAQSPPKRMKVIAQDREIRQSRTERPLSARSYSFATQKTLARKNLKEFEST
ncbi:ras guanine nucleotide exchange factor R-like isoform X2 [Pogonomyrmex barbatus]|nr:ras guanine nucleotide exchange factor R-like isoform X2 [Pogonomyrmex barbatus]